MGDWFPTITTAGEEPSAAAVNTAGQSVPQWQMDPSQMGNAPMANAQSVPGQTSLDYGQMGKNAWDYANSPLGVLALSKMMQKPETPPQPAGPPPRQSFPFSVPPLDLLGGAPPPITVPQAGGLVGGGGMNPYALLFQMLLKGKA